MNKKEGIGNYKLGQKVAIYGYIDAINIENRNDIENTTTLRIKTPVKTISVNPKYEGIINELDKPEKPVLSEVEDEWLKLLKITYPMQYDQLHIITRQGWGYDFEYTICNTEYKLSYEPYYKSKEDTNHVKERLINAILHGYTVKKAKRYIVEIPNNVEGCYNLLVKNHEGKIILGNFNSEYCKNYPNSKLTEAEIKKDFDWAWQFAKEVE